MPRFWKAVVLGLIIGVVGVVLRPTSVGVRLEEDLGLRFLFAVRGPLNPPPDVVVVTIDRTSAQQIDKTTAHQIGLEDLDREKWPPPRHVHADVIRRLSRHGVSAIMMDVFFTSPGSPDEDNDLGEAIAESGKVSLAERLSDSSFPGTSNIGTQSPIEPLQKAALATAPFPLPRMTMTYSFWAFFDAHAGSTPTLPAVMLQIHALPLLDRFIQLLQQSGVPNLGALPNRVVSAADSRHLMKVLRFEISNNPKAATRARALLEGSTVGPLTAADRRVLRALLQLYSGSDSYYLNFYGPPGHLKTIPLHQLLQNDANTHLTLSGKIAVVGEGASGLGRSAEQKDTFPTVYSTKGGLELSGAEIAATAIANLLTDRTLRGVSLSVALAVLIAFGLSVGLLARLLPGLYASGAVLLLGAAFVALAVYQFAENARLVPFAVPMMVQLPLGLFAGLLARYRDVRRQVSTEVDPNARPELADGVCLCTDIENYTAFSEATEPRQLALLMSEYYSAVSDAVVRRHGLMMGRTGDSAMCVWRKPKHSRLAIRAPKRMPFDDKADREMRSHACLAAIEIREAIDQFNARHSTRRLVTRLGLHAGEIALGPVGGEYHVIGDTPNTASRIQSLNKRLGTTLLASAPMVRDVKAVCSRPLGSFVLAGKSAEIPVVEIIGRDSNVNPATRDLVRRFADALRLFEAGHWPDATNAFTDIATDYPADGPTRYYRDLSEHRAGEQQGTTET